MRLNFFGKTLEVIRLNGAWVSYILGEGKKSPAYIVIPEELTEAEVIAYLSDLYHEKATPEFPEVYRIKES